MGTTLSSFALTTQGPVRLYSTQELLRLPPPTWLVDNTIPEHSLAGIYGAPESTKSFAAIDLALCVSTGSTWHGKAVQQGLALYVAAEGGPGISKRVRAWLQHRGQRATDANVAWLIESIAVYAGSDDLDRLMSRLDDELDACPRIIILDTLARCLEGDENQQEDMGRFISGMDKLRHAYGSTVVAVHHTRLDGGRERGNTSFRGGLDTMILVERPDKLAPAVTLSCEKQKDAEHFESLDLRLEVVEGTDSCVLVDHNPKAERDNRKALVLACLDDGPLSWDEWLESSNLPKTTFHRHFSDLKKSDEIVKENGLWGRSVPSA
jgi:hypothetical protein